METSEDPIISPDPDISTTETTSEDTIEIRTKKELFETVEENGNLEKYVDDKTAINIIKNNETDIIKFNEVNIEFTLLQLCCKKNQVNNVKFLLGHYADPNYAPNNSIKHRPLFLVAFYGYCEILKLFLRRNDIEFKPFFNDTALFVAVNGFYYWKTIAIDPNENADHVRCLELLLMDPKMKKYIHYKDVFGCTALHSAAKFHLHEMVLLLLKHGSYIGTINKKGEAAFADISYEILKQHLDECITIDKSKETKEVLRAKFIGGHYATDTDKYIKFNYKFMLPEKNDENQSLNIQQYSKCPTLLLVDMAQVRELRPLLNHPIFKSYLHIRWHRIHWYYFINLFFYLLFWIFLTSYIFYAFNNNIELINNTNKNNITDKNDEINENNDNFIWLIIGTPLLILLILRESFQLYLLGIKYICNKENWLDYSIILLSIFILFFNKFTYIDYLKTELSAIVIMLICIELVLLIGKHPKLSKYIEMLYRVSYDFFVFLLVYGVLILAFALSFYTLFKNLNEKNEYFDNGWLSLFKTIIMLTGEFNMNEIEFKKYKFISYPLFILFVFLIPIVLVNLLNGLAVSDTQMIISEAELVSDISRAHLISYFEKIFGNQKNKIRILCKIFTKKYYSLINLEEDIENYEIIVDKNKNKLIYNNDYINSKNCKNDLKMDRIIMEKAVELITNKELIKNSGKQLNKVTYELKSVKTKINDIENKINDILLILKKHNEPF